jgi:hypothetical protein
MKKYQHNFLALCGIIVLVFALVFVIQKRQESESVPVLTTKRAVVGGVSFDYSSAFGEVVKNNNTTNKGQPNIVIFEQNEGAKAFFNGAGKVQSEAPPTITVHVYEKGTEDTNSFLKKAAPYIHSKGEGRPVILSGQNALSYSWDGLYKGDSVAFTRGNVVYLFSVTYITTEDILVKEYESIVNKVRFE